MFFMPCYGDQSGKRPMSIEHQITAICLTPLLHSTPGFHTDNITINLQEDVQPYHALGQLPLVLPTKGTSDSPRQTFFIHQTPIG